MLTIRCKECNKELASHPTQTKCCGCANMTTVCNDRITAIDLTRVIMLTPIKESKTPTMFSPEDLEFQESRRKRKIRKLNFEVR